MILRGKKNKNQCLLPVFYRKVSGRPGLCTARGRRALTEPPPVLGARRGTGTPKLPPRWRAVVAGHSRRCPVTTGPVTTGPALKWEHSAPWRRGKARPAAPQAANDATPGTGCPNRWPALRRCPRPRPLIGGEPALLRPTGR